MLEHTWKILFVKHLVHLENMLIPVQIYVRLPVQIKDMGILPQILVFRHVQKTHSEILHMSVKLLVHHFGLITLLEHVLGNAQMDFGGTTMNVLKFVRITHMAMKLIEIVMK